MKRRNKKVFAMLLSGMTAMTMMTGFPMASAMAETSSEEAVEETDDSTAEEASEETDDSTAEEASEEADDSTTEEASEETDDSTTEEASEEADDSVSEEEEIDYDFEEAVRPEYSALDYVKLGEYIGLTIDVDEVSVTDEEVEEEMEQEITTDYYEELSEGTVEEGDIANINYVGIMDGEEFDGGSADNYDLTIGSNSFIDGFEDGLIGVEIGETVDLELTFPEDYYEEMAGKEVTFTVTVNSVQRAPELTDDLVEEITDGEYTDVESFRAATEEEILADKEEDRLTEIKTSLLAQVEENSEITEYPEELVEYGVINYRNYYKMYAQYYGVTFEDLLTNYFGIDEEEFETTIRSSAESGFDEELYLGAIAETEGIEVTDEQFEEDVQELAENYGYDDVDEFLAAYGEQELRIVVRNNLVYDFLIENAAE